MVQLLWMRWQVSWVWWHEHSWGDVIKSGCDMICSSYDEIHIVLCYQTYNGVLCSIIWMWWQRYSGCAVRYYQCEVRYNSFDVMSRVLWCHKWWVRCHIQCILCHICSWCDAINRVCVISSIQCFHHAETDMKSLMSYMCLYCLNTVCFMLNIVYMYSET